MKIENIKLPSHPWDKFSIKGGAPAFSKMLGYDKSYDIDSIEECVELSKKYDIGSAGQWSKGGGYKKIEKAENIKLPSHPWDKFSIKGGAPAFSKMLGYDKSYDIDSIEEYVEIGKKHDVGNAVEWSKEYKNIMKIENIKLLSQPWIALKLIGGSQAFTKLLNQNCKKHLNKKKSQKKELKELLT